MKSAKKPAEEVRIVTNGNEHMPEEVIRKRAYELYEERGCAKGLDLDDWLAAEAELRHSTSA